MWSIRQTDTGWEVVRAEGDVLTVVGAPHDTYDRALAAIAEQLQNELAEDMGGEPDGLLPDVWDDGGLGIAFAEATGDGRDFSQVVWSFRDPAVSTLPLMLQTETEIGHFGAQLAGFIATITDDSGTVHATGRFYDSECGLSARNLLLGGRRFGVSVDPGHVAATWECTQEDEDGWCTEERVLFTEYQIIGLTMTPFPAFERAGIGLQGAAPGVTPADGQQSVRATLAIDPVTDHDFVDDNETGFCSFCVSEDDNGDCEQQCGVIESMHQPADDTGDGADGEGGGDSTDDSQSAVRASGLRIPTVPPAAWFNMPEPHPGMNGDLDVYGMHANELLIEQPDGGMAVPLTITDDGRVFGHIARWGQCHVGYPGQCVTPPESAAAYAHFHVGEVRTDIGTSVAVGTLTIGCDHAELMGLSAGEARDHYANAGMGWASVRVYQGQYGAWCCGVLRPGITDQQVHVLRTLSLSGDWRRIGGALELIAALAVNVPGFPIARETVTASGLGLVASGRTGGAMEDGDPLALVAAGIVQRCAECQRRAAAEMARRVPVAADRVGTEVRDLLRDMNTRLAVIERRTRPLMSQARDRLAAQIRQPEGA